MRSDKLKKSEVIRKAIEYELEMHRAEEITTTQAVGELRQMFLFWEEEERTEVLMSKATEEDTPC